MLGERLWMDVPFGQRPARDADNPGLRRLATFLSALLARSQSHRNGLRQAQRRKNVDAKSGLIITDTLAGKLSFSLV